MDEVDMLIHHAFGGEVRVTTLKGILRSEAEETIATLGKTRANNAFLTISGPVGIGGAIPANRVELIEVKRCE